MDFTESVVPHGKGAEKNEPETKSNYESLARLEEEIDSAYSMIESKFSNLWNSASRNAHDLQSNVNLEKHKEGLIKQMSEIKNSISTNDSNHDNESLVQEKLNNIKQQVRDYENKVDLNSLTTKANQALDSLDSKLEIVEQQAGKFVSSFASFFTNVVSVNTPTNEQKPDATPIMPSAAYGSSRFDSELFKLHTTEDYYLSSKSDDHLDLEKFDVDAKSKDISNLLQQYPESLEKMMNKLVPVQTSYKEFWYRYFLHEAKLKSNDQARKELLAAEQVRKDDESKVSHGSEPQEDDEEDFTWDDDDEEAATTESAN